MVSTNRYDDADTDYDIITVGSRYTKETVNKYRYVPSSFDIGTPNNYSVRRLTRRSSFDIEMMDFTYYLKDSDGDYVKYTSQIVKSYSYTPESFDYMLYTPSSFNQSLSGTIEVITAPSTYIKETTRVLNIYTEKLTTAKGTFLTL